MSSEKSYWEKLKRDCERELKVLLEHCPSAAMSITSLERKIALADIHIEEGEAERDIPLFDVKFVGISSGDHENSCWDVRFDDLVNKQHPVKSVVYEDLYQLHHYNLPTEVMDYFPGQVLVDMHSYVTKENSETMVVVTAFIKEYKDVCQEKS